MWNADIYFANSSSSPADWPYCKHLFEMPENILHTLSPGPKSALGDQWYWQVMGTSHLSRAPVQGKRWASASQRYWQAKQSSRREAWSDWYNFFLKYLYIFWIVLQNKHSFSLWSSAKSEQLGGVSASFFFFSFLNHQVGTSKRANCFLFHIISPMDQEDKAFYGNYSHFQDFQLEIPVFIWKFQYSSIILTICVEQISRKSVTTF